MRLSLKAKLTALITLLVLLVVVAVSAFNIASLTRHALADVQSRGISAAHEVNEVASAALTATPLPPGQSPMDVQALHHTVQERLAKDGGLNALLEGLVGFSPVVDYVTITDSDHVVLAHSDPARIGQRLTPDPPYSQLANAGLIRQIRTLYGPPRAYEVKLSVTLRGGQLLGDVRVGVSTVLLRAEVTDDLRSALVLSLLASLFISVFAGVVSFQMLRPLESISRSVDNLARGEFTEPVALERQDEWGILSSKLHLLGERMRGEKAAFVELQENLDQVFSKLSDGLLLFDRQDRLVLASPAVERFLGAGPLAQRLAQEVFSRPTPLHQMLRDAFQKRQSIGWQTFELDGEPAGRVAVSVQFVGAGEQRVGCLVTLRDTGSRAEFQDQIYATTRLAALGHLMSGVAHEVKNPLNAMVLQLEVLKTRLGEEGGKVQSQVNILEAEIRRLDRVVKTFLDFTRPVELRPVAAEVAPLVREVFALAAPQARQNNVQLVLAGENGVPLVRVDRDLIKQALLNLVLNGCQAMPAGGELKVTPRAVKGGVVLEIADTGVGIPPEAQKKVFSLFYTTKPGGTGVGLALAYRVVQLHDGFIDFTSEVNRGTTFRVTLPVPQG